MPDNITATRRFLAACLCALCARPVAADLALDPAVIELHDVSQAGMVTVLYDGEPVSRADIRKVTAGVFKTGNAVPEHKAGGTHFSNYSYMFTFEVKIDGAIVITPVESMLQRGTYDLHVLTTHGTVKGVIDAHLGDSMPSASRSQVTRPAFRVELDLQQYVFGQVVSINLEPDPSRHYTWYLDGKVHSSGQGETSFRAQPEPGTHEVSFIASNAAGMVVSEGSGTFVVTAGTR